jgi:hypothetical protein
MPSGYISVSGKPQRNLGRSNTNTMGYKVEIQNNLSALLDTGN